MMQQKLPDPSGKRPHLWTAPLRDIAHLTPVLVQYATDFTREQLKAEGAGPEEMQNLADYAGSWQQLFKLFARADIKTIGEAYDAIGFTSEPEHYAGKMLNKWLVRSLVGMYFKGLRHALHKGEEPYGFENLEAAMEAVRLLNGKECLSLRERIRNRLLGAFKWSRP